MQKVFVVSDGTGRTAQQALSAALVQFPSADIDVVVRSQVRSPVKVREAVREAAQSGGFIIHTIVSDSNRNLMTRCGRERHVQTIDLMGPLLARLTESLAVTPSERPGLFGQLNKEYFRRIAAMEFAIRHDDGLRVTELRKAEIVLLGVSRTFKTPISMYMAFRGWYVANVPIVLGQELPPIIYKISPRKVFCLNTNHRALAELRQTRSDYLGEGAGEYADREYVRLELMYARDIFARQPEWAVLGVTSKPIEEIAGEILSIRGERGRRR